MSVWDVGLLPGRELCLLWRCK